MTFYAKVENNQITRINVTEKDARKGLINFQGDYAAHGFVPMVGSPPSYDPETQVLSGPRYEIDGETVRRVWTIEVKPMPAPPSSITPRQLILGAMQDGWITSSEAESWANGSSLPAVVLGVINTLPEADRPAARITALRMTEALRANPLLIATATALNIDEEDLDDAFRNWSLL